MTENSYSSSSRKPSRLDLDRKLAELPASFCACALGAPTTGHPISSSAFPPAGPPGRAAPPSVPRNPAPPAPQPFLPLPPAPARSRVNDVAAPAYSTFGGALLMTFSNAAILVESVGVFL